MAVKHPPSIAINGKTTLVGVIGYPVGHTLSPAMHNAAFAELGMNWAYVPLPVQPERVAEAVRGLAALGFRGVNVTVPHKVEVMPHLDEITSVARTIGAVNTIVVEAETGKISGTNTDMLGFMHDLSAHDVPLLSGAKALILGAGGAARAVGMGLAQAGLTLVLVNRNLERAEALAVLLRNGVPHAQIATFSTDQLRAASDGAQLIVNTTPLGMHPNTDQSPWTDGVPFPADCVVYDTVYRPEATRLIQQAQAAGRQAVSGIGMLVGQGAAAFEIWTGQPAPRDLMLRICREQLKV